CFFFQAEDGIRDPLVTGVQTCALPIYPLRPEPLRAAAADAVVIEVDVLQIVELLQHEVARVVEDARARVAVDVVEERFVAGAVEIGRASCRERGEGVGGGGGVEEEKSE